MKSFKQFQRDIQESSWMGDSSMVNPFKEPVKWWNQGRNVRVPNENQASLARLAADDKSQIGKVKVKGNLTKVPNPIWSFTKGLGTGPTPAVRQAFERPVRTAISVGKKFGPAVVKSIIRRRPTLR